LNQIEKHGWLAAVTAFAAGRIKDCSDIFPFEWLTSFDCKKDVLSLAAKVIAHPVTWLSPCQASDVTKPPRFQEWKSFR